MSKRAREGGFSLVLALWALALLAVLAVLIGQSSSRLVRHIRLERDLAIADAAAQSGIALGILDLMAGREDTGFARRFPPAGPPHHCRLDDTATLSIAIEDEAGKVDLNGAGERLLIALLAGVGIDLARARSLAAAIVDFRDGDDIRRPDGAETAEYRGAGLGSGPKNAPFDTVEELHQVLGMTADDVATLRPHVTVHSRLSGVDPAIMGRATRAAIVKGSAELGLGTDGGRRIAGEFTALSPRRVFTIRSEARTAGVVFHRIAIVQLGEDRGSHQIRAWRRADQPLVPEGLPVGGAALPPC